MSAHEGLLDIGTVVDDRYQIQGYLGTGGHSVVYDARQIVTTQRVALKLLREDALRRTRNASLEARFEREMRLVAQFNHPNIVRILDAGRLTNGHLYMALEFVDGETLGAFCQKRDALALGELKILMLQVLDALAFAHQHGVVHRDLKPHNIMVAHLGHRRYAKVLDFGIATLLHEARDERFRDLTATGEFNGTPAYMAPEQLTQTTPTAGADLYAWGLTFLECLTGKPVMHETTVAEIIFRQLSPEPIPIPKALEGHPLGQLLERVTAKSLTRRLSSATEALACLEACDVTTLGFPLDGLDINQAPEPSETTAESGIHPENADPNGQTVVIAEKNEAASEAMSEPASSTLMLHGRQASPGHHEAQPPLTQRSEAPPAHTSGAIHGSSMPIRSAPTTYPGERRQLTVLACGFADVEDLSSTLDPEEFHGMVQTYQAFFSEVIESHGGCAAQRGEQVVGYFGHPVAREDDARHAVQAAYDICTKVSELTARLPAQLGAKIGVHTGPVIVSEGQSEPSLVGPTITLATQLMQAAELGTAALSRTTQRMVEGYFHCEYLGEIMTKGAHKPLGVYAVRARTEARDRLDTRSLLPLVGRKQELSFIVERWQYVLGGSGQVVLLTGEGGIGKSRIVRAFRDKLATSSHFFLEGRCAPEFENSAFYPVIDLLHRLLRQRTGEPSTLVELAAIRQSDDVELEALERLLAQIDAGTLAVPLLASLLSLDTASRHPLPAFTPQRQRHETMLALLHFFVGLSEEQPVTLVLEDLHWADPSTLELLGMLIDQVKGSPLLLLLTARLSFTAPWPIRAHLSQLPLRPLNAEETELLILDLANLYGSREVDLKRNPRGVLSVELVRAVADRSDGVPLFAEELTRMMLESASISTSSLDVPATLQDLLTARLDRLGPAKVIAQLGSVFGRSFGFDALEQVVLKAGADLGFDPPSLREALTQLVDAELLFQRGRPPRAFYTFKHALVQDAAYQSLLRSKRQVYHSLIASVLSEQFAESPPELIAHHYTEANLVSPAIAAWQRAGEAALVASAHAEAIHHLRRGLSLLRDVKEPSDSVHTEIMLQTTLGVALMISRGYAAPEVEAAYARAQTLCHQVGSSPQLFPALWGLWIFFHVRGDYAIAEQQGQALLDLANDTGDTGILLGAHQALGATRFLRGRLAQAQDHFTSALSIYQPENHLSLAFLFGQDAAVFCLSHLAWLAFHLGEPEKARSYIAEALHVCDQIQQPVSGGFARHFAATLFCLLDEFNTAEAHARSVISLAEEVGMPHWEASGQIDLGWAMQASGAPEQGGQHIQKGISMLIAIGSRVALTYWRSALIEAKLRIGHLDDAQTLIEDTFAFIETSDERYFEAEIHRLLGELLLARGGPQSDKEAQSSFQRGVELARKQGALGLVKRLEASMLRNRK